MEQATVYDTCIVQTIFDIVIDQYEWAKTFQKRVNEKNLPEWGEISLWLKYKKTNHYNDALHCTMYYEKPV